MTSIEELVRVRERLWAARAAMTDAVRGAVLSRKRRQTYERIEQSILDELGDVEEELNARVPSGAW